ncbi:hypothetical protein BDZ89DRAFT_1108876 [Hymenopellis radicata]|nr:hypothetical protein BDZ89DRAFT_1108876 [Hymenopellis radicata]
MSNLQHYSKLFARVVLVSVVSSATDMSAPFYTPTMQAMVNRHVIGLAVHVRTSGDTQSWTQGFMEAFFFAFSDIPEEDHRDWEHNSKFIEGELWRIAEDPILFELALRAARSSDVVLIHEINLISQFYRDQTLELWPPQHHFPRYRLRALVTRHYTEIYHVNLYRGQYTSWVINFAPYGDHRRPAPLDWEEATSGSGGDFSAAGGAWDSSGDSSQNSAAWESPGDSSSTWGASGASWGAWWVFNPTLSISIDTNFHLRQRRRA